MPSSPVVRLRGSVNPPLELKDRYLQLAPGQLSPFIRSRWLAHDFCTLLSRFTFRPSVSPSAYPCYYSGALASDSILSCSPCGWYLLPQGLQERIRSEEHTS